MVDPDWKERLLAELRGGVGLRRACALLGFDVSRVYRLQKFDPPFRSEIAAARTLGAASSFRLEIEAAKSGTETLQSKCAQRFASVMRLIPGAPSVAQACRQAEVEVCLFYQAMRAKPARRRAYEELIAALDCSKRGRRRTKHGYGEQAFADFIRAHSSGASQAEAALAAGIPRQIIARRRKKDPVFEALMRSIAEKRASVWGSRLNDPRQRMALLESLKAGVPLVVLSQFGLPCQEAVRQYALRNPTFKDERDEAVRLGTTQRRRDTDARYERVLKLVEAGCPVSKLHLHGLPRQPSIRRRCSINSSYAARYRAALRIGRGNTIERAEISDEQLLETVSRKLPKFLSADERSSCMAQAWLDLRTGSLGTQNVAEMIRRYMAECRPLSPWSTFMDENGDLKSGFQD